MDIWDTFKVLLRRWYVVLPVGILCAIGTMNFSSSVDGEYVAGGVAFIKGPEVQEVIVRGETQIEARNPYLGTGGTDTFARILLESVSSSETRQTFADRGLATAYSLSLDRSEAIIDIEVRDFDPDLAVESVTEVLAMLSDVAAERQGDVDGLDESNLITVEVLSQSEAAFDNSAPRRVFGVLAAASLIVVVGAAFLVEGVVGHLRGDRPSWYSAPTPAAPAVAAAPLTVAVAAAPQQVEYERRTHSSSRRPRREIEAVDDDGYDDNGYHEDEERPAAESSRWSRRTSSSR